MNELKRAISSLLVTDYCDMNLSGGSYLWEPGRETVIMKSTCEITGMKLS